MSYDEYNDLYAKAQKNQNAPYVCFSLDLVGCKKLDGEQFCKQQDRMIQTMKDIVAYIKRYEQKTNTKILLCDKNVKISVDIIDSISPVTYYNNPCILSGDFYALYVYNNTVTEKTFENLFLHFAKKNNLNFDYHFQSAKFEATDYKDGNKKYYLGYCVGYLERNKGDKIISVSKQTDQNLE